MKLLTQQVKGNPLMLVVSFKELITDAPAVMEKVYAYRAAVWEAPVDHYKGSAHESALEAAERHPEVVEEKAWRKSLKSTYPSMKHEQLVAMLEAAVEEGCTRIDLKEDFARYRTQVLTSVAVPTK